MTLDQACKLAGLGTWAFCPARKSYSASPHIRALLGLPEEDDFVPFDAFRTRIVPEDRASFDDAIERAVKEGRMADTEFRALDAAGTIRVFRARTGDDGVAPTDPVVGISGIIQDITDLRQSETALARSLKLERLAGEAARIGGWRYEIATRALNLTPETASLFGTARDQAVSVEAVIARIEDEDERVRLERSFWTCAGAGTRFDEIARFRRLDGDTTWLRVIGEAERDRSGAIIGVYGATQDVDDLIHARSATEEVQALLQAILDALSEGFVIHDRDGTIHYMNRRAHNILGVPDLDLVGGNIWKDFPWAAGSRLKQAVTDALESGESQIFEGEIAMPDQWAKVAVHPTRAGVAIYLSDISGEREAHGRLRLLDDAVRRLNDVVLITDATRLDPPGPTIVFVNEAFVNMTGYTSDEALGANPRMLQGPETERARLTDIRNAIRNRQRIRTELTNYRKDGSRFTVEVDINPLFNAEGVCTHFVSVQRDTTERRNNEERLRASEEQFRLVSMASQEIIWDWDMRSGIIWHSDNYEEVFGRKPLGDGHMECALERMHPEDRLKVTESLDAALASGDASWRCEYRVIAEDGKYRNVADKGMILRDDDGAPRRMVGAMSDVTDIRLLDAQLHQAQKLESVGQLTGGIAHDFNNLLTIILGNCDILLDDIGDDSALRPLIQSIEDAAERGARVSTDLLAFSRRQPLELRATDINALIRRSASLFGRAVDARVDLRYDLTDSPTLAYVDPDKLQAALLNLVLNAKAAIPREGTITIRSRSTSAEYHDEHYNCNPGEFVEIDVIDDGVGMSAEVVERAFEPFFTTKELGVGTGMGLSSVYGLMKQSGGHATINSEPGKGTIIVLCLPIAHEPESDAQTKHAPDAIHRGGGNRILVVEDDTALRSFVSKVLASVGYRIVEAENGAHALKILEQDGNFDLLFTDIVMPGGVNGIQLAEMAREIYPALRILFTSGYARDALPKEGHLPGDIPMLYKPFRTNDLAAKVEEILATGIAPAI